MDCNTNGNYQVPVIKAKVTHRDEILDENMSMDQPACHISYRPHLLQDFVAGVFCDDVTLVFHSFFFLYGVQYSISLALVVSPDSSCFNPYDSI
jgi:hypothetical protein